MILGWLVAIVLICTSQALVYAADMNKVRVVQTGSDQPKAFCAEFHLSQIEAAEILRKSRLITAVEYLQDFEFLPCFVKGLAFLGREEVEWEIRAGGNIRLKKDDGEDIFLGCDECKTTFGRMSK